MPSKHQLVRLYWTRGETLEAIASRYQVSAGAVWKWMCRYGIQRRSMSQAMLAHHNPVPAFRVPRLSKAKERLRSVSVVLYWCEGTHRDGRGREPVSLTFTNSDVRALSVWMRFLREVCGVREKKIRARLYLHQDQSPDALIDHWSRCLRISRTQFERVTVTASSQRSSTRNHDGYRGTVKIRVHSKLLVDRVNQWLQELQETM